MAGTRITDMTAVDADVLPTDATVPFISALTSPVGNYRFNMVDALGTIHLKIEHKGGAADYSGGIGTDNLAPLNAAMATKTFTSTSLNHEFGPKVYLEDLGVYNFSAGINLHKIVTLIGSSNGFDTQGGATTLRFPTDSYGIILNYRDTDGLIVDPRPLADRRSAQGAMFKGIRLLSGGGSSSTAHGFNLRDRGTIEDCMAEGFPGDAFHVDSSVGGGGDPDLRLGNSNMTRFNRATAKAAGRHGFYIAGTDSNGITLVACEVKSAAACAFKDISGLGSNFYMSPVAHGYGTNGQGICSHGGENYLLISDVAGIGSTTTPGTDASVWNPTGAAATYPAWNALNTYSVSMPFYFSGDSNRSVVGAPYSEGGISHASGPTMALGGQSTWSRRSKHMRGVDTVSRAIFCNTGFGGHQNLPLGHEHGTFLWSAVGHDHDRGVILESLRQATNHKLSFRWRGSDFAVEYDSSAVRSWGMSGRGTAMTFGRTTAVEGVFHAKQLALGDNVGSGLEPSTAYRIMRMAAAAPTSGEVARGEIIFNNAPSAAGVPGWVCTTGGVAGSTAVTKAMAALAA